MRGMEATHPQLVVGFVCHCVQCLSVFVRSFVGMCLLVVFGQTATADGTRLYTYLTLSSDRWRRISNLISTVGTETLFDV